MKFTLDNKILSGLGACTLVLIVVGYISYQNSQKFRETNQWVDHTNKVLYGFEQILVTELEAESSMRGYVISGNENFLKPYNKAIDNIYFHIDNVKELTIDNSVQQKRIEIIQGLVQAHLSHLDNCIKLRKENFAKAQTLVVGENGRILMQKIRDNVDEAKDMESKLLEQRSIASEKDGRDFNFVFLSLVVLIIVVLISVYFIVISNLRALRKAEKETSDKNWTLTGSGQLAQEVQGNLFVHDLGQYIINHLVTYLKINLGALYIGNDAGVLNFSNGYCPKINIGKMNRNDVRNLVIKLIL